MPTLTAKTPSLYKPKSKIRLRLGLTSAQPAPPPKEKENATSPPSVAEQQGQSKAKAKDLKSTRSFNNLKGAFNPSTTKSNNATANANANATTNKRAASSPLADRTDSLNTSQITHSSRSRPDSRDAFALEISPSSQSALSHAHSQQSRSHSHSRGSHHRLNFDTISYATQSPASVALNKFPNTSYATLPTDTTDTSGTDASETDAEAEGAYPTPSPSSSPSQLTSSDADLTRNGYGEDGEGESTTVQPGIQPEDPTLLTRSHPHVASEVTAASDSIFHLTDDQLGERFAFIQEIGYGNWGSVWLCRPRRPRSSKVDPHAPNTAVTGPVARLGRAAAAGGGAGGGGRIAIKLVHRSKSPTTSARVRALWGEMKIIRALRHEPHPSIIQFEAFVVTPSYALVIMPYLSELIPVCLPVERATPYFRQLCSAVGYLHERGITHNDIKPANVLLSHNDIPVLVDFGFAQKWDVGERGSFLSSISWGTPEYLDPQRAKGMPHDERASDVWSLGITMFEVLAGRTPFEDEDQTDELITPDDLIVYYDRSRSGHWVGNYRFIPKDIQHLLRSMICPDPAYRITAMQAYHHPSLQPAAPSEIITPHFVRAAATYEEDPEPLPSSNAAATKGKDGKDKKKRKAKKREAGHGREAQPRVATPALGESIKQHTFTAAQPVVGGGKVDAGKKGANMIVESTPSPLKKVVLVRKSQEALDVSPNKEREQDPTPTRKSKPAQPLRVKEQPHQGADKRVVSSAGLRSSDSQPKDLAQSTNDSLKTVSLTTTTSNTAVSSPHTSVLTTRPESQQLKQPAQPQIQSQTLTHHESRRTLKSRDSNLSLATSTSTAVYTKEEAVLKAMRSLEGVRRPKDHASATGGGAAKEKERRNVLGVITRPAPSPPRPRSLDSQVEVAERDSLRMKKEEQRRSLGLERTLMDVVEESPVKTEFGLDQPEPAAQGRTIKIAEPARPLSPARADNSATTSPTKPQECPSTPQKSTPGRKPTPFPGTPAVHGTPTKVASPLRNSVTSTSSPNKRVPSMASPPRPRLLATRPTEVVADGRPFPAGTTGKSTEQLPFPIVPMEDGRQSPMTELRERILSDDLGTEKHLVRFRQLSGDLIAPSSLAGAVPAQQGDAAAASASSGTGPANGAEVQMLGGRLDQLALWVKDVEKMVEDARKALAEGREPPLSLPLLNMQMPIPSTASTIASQLVQTPSDATASSKEPVKGLAQEHRFGVTPDKPDVIPAHLRTCSTQVEPATPPKWMTYEEAEERVRLANEWNEEKSGVKRAQKKERPTVSHVLKLFGNDKLEKMPMRSQTPEPLGSVPLKGSKDLAHTLRDAPSTPALRSFNTTRQSSKPLTRKSESNLRNFNTMPSQFMSLAEALRPLSPTGTTEYSPRRVVYDDLLESEPGVVRQGDGWSSLSSGKGMAKPSSMISLRERALAFLRDDKDKDRDQHQRNHRDSHRDSLATMVSGVAGGPGGSGGGSVTMRERQIVDLAQEADKRNSKSGAGGENIRRPGTPGANSILGMKGAGATEKDKKGLFGRFKGRFAGASRKEKEEVVVV